MEIKQFMDMYRTHSPKEFFDWLSQERFLEIRFLSNYNGEKFNDWDLIKILAEKLNLEYRYSSLFINDYESLQAILLYKIGKYPLTRLYNIFISVNPKRKVNTIARNGLVTKSYYGGIAGTSHIQTILCDIEHDGDRAGNATENMIQECIEGAKYLCKLLKIEDYWINISGNGVHLWFQLEEAIELPIPSSREIVIKGKQVIKYNIKEEPINTFVKTYNRFIEKLNRNLKEFNPILKVDEGAKDLSRIARPPGSWNVKKNKTARAVGTAIKLLSNIKYNNNQFMAVKPLLNLESRKYKEIKSQTSHNRYNYLNIGDSPLSKLLTSGLLPSTLSRNHYLEQGFARLLRDNDIKIHEIPKLIAEMDNAQQKPVQVDPDYLDDEGHFNPEMINAYCYACRLMFVYPIMEDSLDINDGYITVKHSESLNAYSWQTVEVMTADIKLTKPKSYFELKTLVRKLVDEYERSVVFFTIKNLLKDEWKYYGTTRLIQKIMNKTRRRKE